MASRVRQHAGSSRLTRTAEPLEPARSRERLAIAEGSPLLRAQLGLL